MTTRLHGHNWNTYPRTWRDVIACLLGRHKAILRAVDGGVYVRRCSCGATSMVHGRWSRPETLRLRRSTPEPVDYDSEGKP